ncbi:MAG TPA: endo-1,4-beta-xylanase [bacterium]|nr:endo-1,4-beta-xylanase [bacterium]HPN41874.1 endo-1,4-beta-xylanase [bacterium]
MCIRKTTRVTINFIIMCLVCAAPLFAEEDSYHQNLRNQLKTDYDLEGGEWVLTDQENTTNKLTNLSGVTKKIETGSGSEPFTEIVRLTVTQKGANAWDNAVRFAIRTAIKKDDVLLLVIWVRGVHGEQGMGRIQHIFEMTTDPYSKDLDIGQEPAAAWQQWMLPFQAGKDHAVGQARYQINMGYMQQVVEIGGLALLNYGNKYTLEELPRSLFDLDYDGRDLNAPWRVEAQQRIEQYRKAPVTIQVINKNDHPVKNAGVQFNMLQHEFGFGTAIAASRMLENSTTADIYREKLENLSGDGKTFNIVVVENALKWPPWENPWWPGGRDGVASVVEWFRDRDIKVRGHNLVWPGWTYLPDDIKEHQADTTYIRDRIFDHIEEITGYPGIYGEIAEWDVINEAAHNFDLENVFGTKRIYIDWFNWAKLGDPNALLYINDYSIIINGGSDLSSQQRYKELIQYLIDNAAPLDGIGIQGHFGSPLTAPARVYEILQDFGSFNKDISITEYDAVEVPAELAADYMRDLLTICFSHPAVQNFLMWGFWDGQHWGDDAPIFKQDWTLKPSGEAFINQVFNEWWTNATGSTNAQGLFATSGFLGKYEVVVDIENIHTVQTVNLSKSTDVITVKLDSDVTDVGKEKTARIFSLAQNYPNPFNPVTTINYTIPVPVQARLEIININGQTVAVPVSKYHTAGDYEIKFDAAQLPAGIYFYRLSAGSFTKTAKMLLLK